MAAGKAFCAGFVGSCMGISVLFGLIFAPIAFNMAFHRLDSTDMAVTWDPFTRQLRDVRGAGLYVVAFQKFVKYPSTLPTISTDVSCVTKDGLMMDMLATFQYQIIKSDLIQITKEYRDFDKYHKLMNTAAERAIHYACSQFNIGQFQSQRMDVQYATKDKMQHLIHDMLHADIMDVQLKNVQPPDDWKTAVASKQQAQQDILLASNERDQSIAKVNGDLKLAQQSAEIMLEEARTNATVILQDAISQAAGIGAMYQQQAEIAANITKTNGLSINGYIAYLQNRLMEQQNSLDVAMDTPQADVVSQCLRLSSAEAILRYIC
ncbi:g7933 [Coccomyxa elongata]